MSDAARETTRRENSVFKVILISLSGSAIEWYDFFIYGLAAALVFNQLFFPNVDPIIGTLAAFSTFTVGFIARPLGGIIWGHFGDRVGRKKALVTAILLMGTATTLIGALPTYETIGILAPILLVVLRISQGLAVGGQYGGAVLIATENAPRNRRGLYGSFPQMSIPVAVISSNAVFLILTAALAPEQFAAWGWRIPFLLSILLVIVGLYAQLRLEETPAFQRVQEAQPSTRQRSPVLEVLRTHPRYVALAAGTYLVVNGAFYILITYVPAYGTETLGVSQSTMLTGVLIAAAFSFLTIPGFAMLSDKVGRRPVFVSGAIFTILFAFPLFWMIDTRSAILISLAVLLANTGLNAMFGPQAALFSEMFGTRVRYSGASLGIQLGAILGGGFAPLISTSLYAATGSSASISAYIAVMAIVSLVSVLLINETFQNDADEVEEQRSERETAAATGRTSELD